MRSNYKCRWTQERDISYLGDRIGWKSTVLEIISCPTDLGKEKCSYCEKTLFTSSPHSGNAIASLVLSYYVPVTVPGDIEERTNNY